MNTKALLTSKTFWFNILTVVIALAGVVGFADFQPTKETAETTIALVGIANILLRLLTRTSIDRVK